MKIRKKLKAMVSCLVSLSLFASLFAGLGVIEASAQADWFHIYKTADYEETSPDLA